MTDSKYLKDEIDEICRMDPNADKDLLRQGAADGSLACTLMLREASLMESDKVKALDYTRQAARLGDPRCMYHVAVIDFANGDYDEAYKWMRRAYINDIEEASFGLARMSAYGLGTARDLEQASLYMEQAYACDAEPDQREKLNGYIEEQLAAKEYQAGNVCQAMERLRRINTVNGWLLLAVIDTKNRKSCLEKAVDLDDPEASYLLALMETDKKRAFRLLKNAAKAGWTAAYEPLAECYEKGDGVSPNAEEARRWHEAAKNHHE